MSVATPTLLPRPARFPHLLPPAPRVLPQPLKRRTSYGHLNATRNLQKELDDLSEEEVDLEEQVLEFSLDRSFPGSYHIFFSSPEHRYSQPRLFVSRTHRAQSDSEGGEG